MILPKCGKHVKAIASLEKLINNKKSTSENISNQFMLTKKRKIR